jgi:hypothetical protein
MAKDHPDHHDAEMAGSAGLAFELGKKLDHWSVAAPRRERELDRLVRVRRGRPHTPELQRLERRQHFRRGQRRRLVGGAAVYSNNAPHRRQDVGNKITPSPSVRVPSQAGHLYTTCR